MPEKGQQPCVISLDLAPEPSSPFLLREPGEVKSTHTFLEAAVTVLLLLSHAQLVTVMKKGNMKSYIAYTVFQWLDIFQ